MHLGSYTGLCNSPAACQHWGRAAGDEDSYWSGFHSSCNTDSVTRAFTSFNTKGLKQGKACCICFRRQKNEQECVSNVLQKLCLCMKMRHWCVRGQAETEGAVCTWRWRKESVWRMQRKELGAQERRSATGSLSVSYWWPQAKVFRHWGIPRRGQGGRRRVPGREGGRTQPGGRVAFAVCCQRRLLHKEVRKYGHILNTATLLLLPLHLCSRSHLKLHPQYRFWPLGLSSKNLWFLFIHAVKNKQ